MNRNHLIFLFLFFVSSYQITAQIVDSGFVFKEAPFPSCHASTICSTADGYMVAWFGGTHEKHKDVGIWIARSTDGQWTAPVEVANGIQHADKRYPCWNPVLFRNAETGDISLYYKVGPSPREWWGMLMVSSDEGLTWSLPRRLPEDILGPIKNKPELLANGMLLHPSSTESDTDGWKVHMEISDMDGNNWKRIGPLPEEDIDAIQPSILIHPGKLQILCRSKKSGIVQSWSNDGGLTWTPLEETGLPNPNSGIDAVSTEEGQHYLVYNPTSPPEGQWGGERYPLVLAVSQDGLAWKTLVTLESEPGEYSYPAIIEGGDGNLHITYTWKRDRIKYVVYKP